MAYGIGLGLMSIMVFSSFKEKLNAPNYGYLVTSSGPQWVPLPSSGQGNNPGQYQCLDPQMPICTAYFDDSTGVPGPTDLPEEQDIASRGTFIINPAD